MQEMSIVWLAATVIFGVLEAVTVGLTSIWFAAGALLSFIVSFFGGEVWLQVAVFLVTSLLTLLLVRPLVKSRAVSQVQATNADRLIGMEAEVTEEIDNFKGRGQVLVAGIPWTARAEQDGQVIPAKARVRILRIEGVKVIVALVERPVGETEEKISR